MLAMFSKLKGFVPLGIKNSYHFCQSYFGALVFRFPARKLKLIGVTGTDGKTTTSSLIYHILQTGGVKTSLISTVDAKIGGESIETGLHVTTPDPVVLQKLLKKMVDRGSEYGVVETTSHGLAQERVAAVGFYAAVVTNITHEHLDYHKTYENYLAAKSKILQGVKLRVLNADDSSFKKLRDQGSGLLVTYSVKVKADYMAKEIVSGEKDLRFKIVFSEKDKPQEIGIRIPIVGDYNIYNVLAAFALCHRLGVDEKKIAESLESFTTVTGRMEKIDQGQDFQVIVDFAHTPAALQAALLSLKRQSSGKLIAVLGSAGERDRDKRKMMGRISAKVADLSIFTAEDPRSEDVNEIIASMVAGAKQEDVEENIHFLRIPNREEAIKKAIEMAERDDIVGIFGKGHEKSMNIGGTEYPWSDQEAASKILKEKSR